MPTTAKQLVEAANAAVPKISGKEAQEMVAKGAVLIDIRDSRSRTVPERRMTDKSHPPASSRCSPTAAAPTR